MADPALIIAEYYRQEKAAGGIAKADTNTVLAETAKALGVDFNEARRVLIDHWAMAGSG